MQENNKLSN